MVRWSEWCGPALGMVRHLGRVGRAMLVVGAGGGRTQPFTCSVLLLVCLVGVALKCCVMCIVLSLVVPYRSIAGSCKFQKKIKIKIKKILQYSIT